VRHSPISRNRNNWASSVGSGKTPLSIGRFSEAGLALAERRQRNDQKRLLVANPPGKNQRIMRNREQRNRWSQRANENWKPHNDSKRALNTMKTSKTRHVFYLHSIITEAIAEAVVAELRLKKDDVVVVCGRGYSPKARWAGLIQSELKNVPDGPHSLPLPSAIRLIRSFDKWLKNFCSENFMLYIPQSSIPLIVLLANHPGCKAFNYIEEGLSYYTHPVESNIPRKLSLYRVWPLCRVRPRCFFEEGYKTAFVTRNNALKSNLRKVIVNPVFSEAESKELVGSSESACVAVFVLQTVKWMNANEACAYFNAIRDALEQCAARGEQVFYKMHPEQVGSDEGDLIKAIMRKFSANQLPQDFCLETLPSSRSNLYFVTLNSSFLLYSKSAATRIRFVGPLMANYLPRLDQKFSNDVKLFENLISEGIH
jgi:hypothetical protein